MKVKEEVNINKNNEKVKIKREKKEP